MVQFENADVAAKFEALREKDGHVHIPAGKKTEKNPNPVGYSGPLSKITLDAAQKALASGSNILKAKEGVQGNRPGSNSNGAFIDKSKDQKS